jgi:hypothetical protein
MAADGPQGLLKPIDKSQRDPFASLARVVVDSFLNVRTGTFPQNNRLCGHTPPR